jgi:hypothetical protein
MLRFRLLVALHKLQTMQLNKDKQVFNLDFSLQMTMMECMMKQMTKKKLCKRLLLYQELNLRHNK